MEILPALMRSQTVSLFSKAEKADGRPEQGTTYASKNFPPPYNNNLVRSKTLPDIPTLDQEDNNSGISGLKRPAGPTLQASPVVPKRSSSKQMVETMLNDDPYCNRRPLRNFFSNA